MRVYPASKAHCALIYEVIVRGCVHARTWLGTKTSNIPAPAAPPPGVAFFAPRAATQVPMACVV